MKKDDSSLSRTSLMETYSEKRGVCVTVIILAIMIGIFAVAYIAFGNETKIEDEAVKVTVQLVSVIFKHGEIAPLITYENDPYKNESYWPFGRGELTKKGRQNMFALGKFLRDRYTGFLPELYYPSDIQSVSSDTDRCFMSASILLAGLYPPHKFQVWNPYLLWQPIPIKQIPANTDTMLDISETCARLTEELKFWENDMSKNESVQKTLRYISEKSGSSVLSIRSLREFYDLFSMQVASGLEIPEWVKEIFPHKLYDYSVVFSRVYTMIPKLLGLGTGMLLNDVVNHMNQKARNETIPKLFLYAANDPSIVKLMAVLNLNFTNATLPGFGASVLIELHYIFDKYTVEAYYMKHHNSKHVIPVNITGCPTPCYLEEFVHLTREFIPQNWTRECQL